MYFYHISLQTTVTGTVHVLFKKNFFSTKFKSTNKYNTMKIVQLKVRHLILLKLIKARSKSWSMEEKLFFIF